MTRHKTKGKTIVRVQVSIHQGNEDERYKHERLMNGGKMEKAQLKSKSRRIPICNPWDCPVLKRDKGFRKKDIRIIVVPLGAWFLKVNDSA